MKRPLLYLLVCSVAISAILGIAIVLQDQWGWLEIRVMLTTATLAVASLCGLACDLSKTPRGPNLLPSAGLGLTFLATAMVLMAIWLELQSETFWKLTAITSIFSVATTHVCLLLIAQLARRFQWVLLLAMQLIYGLAALLGTMILWEIADETMAKIVAVIAIVNVALTIVIPLLHRISKTDARTSDLMTPLEARSVEAIDKEIDLHRKRIAELERVKAKIAGFTQTTG
jgi:hypothetical protein